MNAGDEDLTDSLSASQDSDCNGFTSNLDSDQSVVSVGQGESETVTLTVIINDQASGDCITTVNANGVASSTTENAQADVEVTTTAEVVGEYSVDLEYLNPSNGSVNYDGDEDEVEWTVDVENTGDYDANIQLALSSESDCDSDGLYGTVDPQQMSLSSGDKETATVTVDLPDGSSIESGDHCFVLEATVTNDPNAADQANDSLNLNLKISEVNETTASDGDGVGNSGDIAVIQVVTGSAHTCVLYINGSVACWGDNTRGQLGITEIGYSIDPIVVEWPDSFTQISAGNNHTCGVTTAGEAHCWGDSFAGKLGDGSFYGNPLGLDYVYNELGIMDISCGYSHSLQAVGDINGDGVPEVAFGDECNSDVKVVTYENHGGSTGNSSISSYQDLSFPNSIMSILMEDINSDGLIELAVALSGSQGEIHIMSPNASSNYPLETHQVIDTSNRIKSNILAKDVNSDGFQDLVFNGDNELCLSFSNGTSFDTPLCSSNAEVGWSKFGIVSYEDDMFVISKYCLLYTSPSPRDATLSRMPSSA